MAHAARALTAMRYASSMPGTSTKRDGYLTVVSLSLPLRADLSGCR